jgi:hypothetical protein
VTYSDVGGCKEQIEKLREVVETPLLHVSWSFLHLNMNFAKILIFKCSPIQSLGIALIGTPFLCSVYLLVD